MNNFYTGSHIICLYCFVIKRMVLPVSSYSDITMPLNIQSCRAMSLVLLWFFTAYISFFTLGFERSLILYSYLSLVVIFVPITGWIEEVTTEPSNTV